MIQDYLFKIGDEVFVPMIGDKPAKVHQIESTQKIKDNKGSNVGVRNSYTYASAMYSYNEETYTLKVDLYNFSDRFLHYILEENGSYFLTIDVKYPTRRLTRRRVVTKEFIEAIKNGETCKKKYDHIPYSNILDIETKVLRWKSRWAHIIKGLRYPIWNKSLVIDKLQVIESQFPIMAVVNKENYDKSFYLDLSTVIKRSNDPLVNSSVGRFSITNIISKIKSAISPTTVLSLINAFNLSLYIPSSIAPTKGEFDLIITTDLASPAPPFGSTFNARGINVMAAAKQVNLQLSSVDKNTLKKIHVVYDNENKECSTTITCIEPKRNDKMYMYPYHYLNIKPILFREYPAKNADNPGQFRACKLKTKIQTIHCEW